MTSNEREPQVDDEPDKDHGDPVMEQFQRSGSEEGALDQLGEGEQESATPEVSDDATAPPGPPRRQGRTSGSAQQV